MRALQQPQVDRSNRLPAMNARDARVSSNASSAAKCRLFPAAQCDFPNRLTRRKPHLPGRATCARRTGQQGSGAASRRLEPRAGRRRPAQELLCVRSSG